ncbi:MAG: peptidoglycan bridge formation glycyltransferase FemA/FemB family protein, partial [Chloroflexi bacterium]|nr:peptidoglycan bridge formation glycyltransferase FemA/FemB family protein [Chloroflexota bacterium]
MSDSYRIVENPAPPDWNEFVRARGGHALQSTPWGDLKSRFGWSALRLGFARDGEYAAGAQILFRALAPGLLFAYVPRGPVADPADRATLAALLDAAAAAARARGAFVLKIELNWISPAPIDDAGLASMCQTPVRPANPIQPRTTIHVDLTRDLDTLLTKMKPKWRYNLRLAE